MFESIKNIFKKSKRRELLKPSSKDAAKERLHLVLMQDRANVSADFLDLMRKEIIEVIKKYIEIDEKAIDVRLTNETNEDGVLGAPALYANIPIINIKDEARKLSKTNQENKIDFKPPTQEAKNKEINSSNEENKEEKDIAPKEENKEEANDTNIEKNNIRQQDESDKIENSSKKTENSTQKKTKNQVDKSVEIKTKDIQKTNKENTENPNKELETKKENTKEQNNIKEENKNEE